MSRDPEQIIADRTKALEALGMDTDAARLMATETQPRIVTSFVCPPIPYRGNDWCAYRDGQEEAGGYGYGETEAEAIQDLLEIEGRFDPEPRKETGQ